MSFPWIPQPSRRSTARSTEACERQIRSELRDRAALYYRLRYSAERATKRLIANVAYDFEVGLDRPSWLSDGEIANIVKATYERRPAS